MADPVLAEDDMAPRSPLASPRIWAAAALVFALLFLAYWFFIRTAYEPLLTNVAPQDAADIVKVLDERKVPYQLADGGRSILVARNDVDMARIELVGSELPMRGQVGFELFNQSDMGLTEFAQKINYQRALQGELARTILSLDGIRSVRVHLGLPERSVFRDEQVQPKASVALSLQPGTALTEATVAGVQRMIAGAIPEMRAENVAVLDGSGRVISAQGAGGAEPPPAASDAVLENYRDQITAAVARAHPELRYDLNLSLRQLASQGGSDDGEAGAPNDAHQPAARAAPRGNPDFAVNVRVTTTTALDGGLRLDLMREIQDVIGFDPRRGDAILFLVGEALPSAAPVQAASEGLAASDRVVAKAAQPSLPAGDIRWTDYWPLAVVLIAVLLLAGWYSDRRRKARARPDLLGFAEQLRQRIHIAERAGA